MNRILRTVKTLMSAKQSVRLYVEVRRISHGFFFSFVILLTETCYQIDLVGM